MWPNDQQECCWEPPPVYYDNPIITLIGVGRRVYPKEDLLEECIDCFLMFEEKYDEYDEEETTNWEIELHDSVSLNGTKFQTYSTDKRRIRKRSVALMRWEDDEGKKNASFAVIRLIMKLIPFPNITTVLNGVFVRVSFYDEIERLNDGITICSLNRYSSEVYPLHVAYPTNFVVSPLDGDRVAIIDLEKQFQ